MVIIKQRAKDFELWFKNESSLNPEIKAKRDEMISLARQMENRQGNYSDGLIASSFGVICGYAMIKGFLPDVMEKRQEYLASFLAALESYP